MTPLAVTAPVAEIAAARSSENPSVGAMFSTIKVLLAKLPPSRIAPRFTLEEALPDAKL